MMVLQQVSVLKKVWFNRCERQSLLEWLKLIIVRRFCLALKPLRYWHAKRAPSSEQLLYPRAKAQTCPFHALAGTSHDVIFQLTH